MPSPKKQLIVWVLIMLLASFLRLYRLDELPPGLCMDTAYTGTGAIRILQGEYPIFFEASWGGNIEPMYVYVLAAFFFLLGMTPFVLKLVSAILGIITVPMLYLFTRELLGSKGIALLASFWLAVSYWHLTYSRMGREIVLVPLLLVVTLWFLLRGLRTGRRREFVWAGVSLGVSLYNYQPMRFLPILIILYLGCRIVIDRGFWKAHRWKLMVPLLIALLLFVPLGSYFVTHTEVFLRNARNVSIFNPELNQGSPLRAMARGAAETMASFHVLPDPSWRQNPAGRPLLDPVTGLLFLAGLGISLVRWRQPSHLLILIWLFAMSLPAVLAVPVPHSARSIGLLPVACILPAMGVHGAMGWLRRRGTPKGFSRLLPFVLGSLLFVVALSTYMDYFTVWGREELAPAYDVAFAEAAEAMNDLSGAAGVWILPLTSLADSGSVHETVEFLYRGDTPHYFLRTDETTVAEELTEIAQGYDEAWVIEWNQTVLGGAYLYHGDPKGVLSFLLRKYGCELDRQAFGAFDAVSYQLSAQPDFTIVRSLEPVDANYADQVALRAVAYGGSSHQSTSTATEVDTPVLPSAKQAWVVLQWEALTPLSRDYKAAVYLVDDRGRLLGQMDKIMLSNDLRTTSQWYAGQVAIDYYTLLSPPATPPGECHIEVGVYDSETMVRLPVLDEEGKVSGQSVRAGTLEIVKPLVSPKVEPQVKVSDGEMAPDVRLLGYDIPLREVEPGGTVRVALYWQALRDVEDDYVVAVQLRGKAGEVWVQQMSRPVDGTYPTTEWDEAEVLRDWHDVRVPASTSQGRYDIFLQVMEGGAVLGQLSLGEVEVSGRPHYFTMPRIDRRLELMVGDSIKLLGYDLQDQELQAGDVLELTLYWQAIGEMKVSYTVFTHLLDHSDQTWAQKDSVPGDGSMPTNTWIAGEVITDVYSLEVDADAPPGEYILEMGMYEAATGQRLPIYDASGEPLGDRVLSEKLAVRP
jgi:4-amino-4-deoxy-L-arabinose transferase-like glycosyltransferase